MEGAEEVQPWDPITFYIPSFIVAFAFFLIGQMAKSLLLEKEEGTLRRLMSAPMPRSAILGFVLLALGGSIYPLFRAEGFIGTVSRLTPSAWGIEGFMGVVADHWTLAQTTPNILVLLAFAAVFFAVAVWRFRYE